MLLSPTLQLPDLVNKITACPVTLEFQRNNGYFFSISVSHTTYLALTQWDPSETGSFQGFCLGKQGAPPSLPLKAPLGVLQGRRWFGQVHPNLPSRSLPLSYPSLTPGPSLPGAFRENL